MKVIDFSSGPPSAASIKAAGYGGVMLYLSDGREDWMTGKAPSREYLDTLDEHGIKFGWVWQYRAGGSIDKGDAGRGYEGGYTDASEALKRLNDLKCPNHPVIFAVDWDVTLAEWNSRVVNYFRGAAAKLGKDRVGIYGHSRVVHWAMEDDVVATVEPGRVLGWVTRSWGSVNADGTGKGSSYATLYQHAHNVPGPDGVQIDINDTWHEEWGHRPLPEQRTRPGSTPFQLHGVEYPCDAVLDTPDSGWRDPYACQAGVIHTTENGDGTPPENVANWQTNPANQSSYNVLCGADATGARTLRTNPDNRRSWSTGEPGNTTALHFSNIGWANRTADDWFANPIQLERNAEWVADLHLRYGLPLVWLTPDDLKAGRKGFTSHGNWWRGIGGPAPRTDPGASYPHNWVLNRAKEIINEGEDMSFTDEDRKKLDRVHHELTHEFQTLYRDANGVQSTWRGTLMGFILQLDRKIEDLHANQMPWLAGKLNSIASSLKVGKKNG